MKKEYLFPLNKPFEFHFLTDFSRFPLLSPPPFPLDVRRHKKPISSGLRGRGRCSSRGCLKPKFKRNVNFDFQDGHLFFFLHWNYNTIMSLSNLPHLKRKFRIHINPNSIFLVPAERVRVICSSCQPWKNFRWEEFDTKRIGEGRERRKEERRRGKGTLQKTRHRARYLHQTALYIRSHNPRTQVRRALCYWGYFTSKIIATSQIKGWVTPYEFRSTFPIFVSGWSKE